MLTKQTLDITKFWEEVVNELKEEISTNHLNVWFSDVYPLKLDEGGKTLVLGVPNELTRGHILKKYERTIISAMMNKHPSIKNIKLTISRSVNTKKNPTKPIGVLNSQESNYSLGLPNSHDIKTNLNPDYTIENFIVSDFNRFAFAAAESVMKNLGTAYNPLYIYGPSGIGKTHLLQAIGNSIKKKYPDLNVYYMTSHDFLEKYMLSFKNLTTDSLRKNYTNYHLFILDDFQLLDGKDATLMELFNIFNTLSNKNSQIIFSSDKEPNSLTTSDQRIKTRLRSGIIVDIGSPTTEDLKIICRNKSTEMGINLSDEAVDYISENINPSIREIVGALTNIQLREKLNNKDTIHINDIKEYVKSYTKPKTSHIPPIEIIRKIADYYSIQDKKELESKTRRKEIVKVRQMAMYILREYQALSFSYIGKLFGGRDHTTVMHAVEKVAAAIQDNVSLAREFNELKKKLEL